MVVLGGVRLWFQVLKVSRHDDLPCCFGGCFRKPINNPALPHSNRRPSYPPSPLAEHLYRNSEEPRKYFRFPINATSIAARNSTETGLLVQPSTTSPSSRLLYALIYVSLCCNIPSHAAIKYGFQRYHERDAYKRPGAWATPHVQQQPCLEHSPPSF